jgi:toxin-antitoxin system PIN domain toxin
MKLVDSKVWLALTLSGHDQHESALNWLQGQAPDHEAVFCRATQQSVLRLLTTKAVLSPFGLPPLANAEAWQVMESFLADPRIGFAAEPAGLDSLWRSLAARQTASPKLWMDAYLAAFAIQGGYELVTLDRAFQAFDGLDLTLLEPS